MTCSQTSVINADLKKRKKETMTFSRNFRLHDWKGNSRFSCLNVHNRRSCWVKNVCTLLIPMDILDKGDHLALYLIKWSFRVLRIRHEKLLLGFQKPTMAWFKIKWKISFQIKSVKIWIQARKKVAKLKKMSRSNESRSWGPERTLKSHLPLPRAPI